MKVLSDSPAQVELLVRLAFSYRSLTLGKHHWFLFSDDKLSFIPKSVKQKAPERNDNVYVAKLL